MDMTLPQGPGGGPHGPDGGGDPSRADADMGDDDSPAPPASERLPGEVLEADDEDSESAQRKREMRVRAEGLAFIERHDPNTPQVKMAQSALARQDWGMLHTLSQASNVALRPAGSSPLPAPSAPPTCLRAQRRGDPRSGKSQVRRRRRPRPRGRSAGPSRLR